MKKPPKGVFVNAAGSVGIDFRYQHVRSREILSPNGVVLKANAANFAYAERYRETVLKAMAAAKMGGPAFQYAQYFPQSPRLKSARRPTDGDTVDALIRRWLAHARKGCAVSTMRGFNAAGKEFIERWGSLHYTDVTVSKIKEWIADSQAQGRILHTIKNCIRVLRGALDDAAEQAEEHGEIYYNPARRIIWDNIRPTQEERVKRKKEVIQPFDYDEIERVLHAASPSVANFIVVAFGLGARINELFGLAWEDIDLVKLTLHFQYGRVSHQDTTLKTEESDRWIDLAKFPHVTAALQREKARSFLYPPVNCGKNGERHLVFYHPTTKQPYKYDLQFRKIWTRLLRKAGVVYRAPKQMRHTFATLYRVAGYPDLWIASILGHTTTMMLQRHYGVRWPSNADKMGDTKAQLTAFWRKHG